MGEKECSVAGKPQNRPQQQCPITGPNDHHKSRHPKMSVKIPQWYNNVAEGVHGVNDIKMWSKV